MFPPKSLKDNITQRINVIGTLFTLLHTPPDVVLLVTVVPVLSSDTAQNTLPKLPPWADKQSLLPVLQSIP